MTRITDKRCIRNLFLVAISFILGCMITINLTPIEKTCRIDDSDREYNIMKNSKLRNPELIILIFSAPNNLEKRNTVRETWLQLCGNENEDQSGVRFKHYFVIGSLSLNQDQILHLSSEQSQYSDILILPMHDSYKNLTTKVLKSFEWLNDQYDYGLGFKYVLKCDDDTFVNIQKLVHEIQIMESMLSKSKLNFPLNLPPEKLNPFISTNVQANGDVIVGNLSWYWGFFNGKARVYKSGKWKETEWISCDKYVPYALGGGYILSKPLISFIGKNANNLRWFHSEDVSVGFWLAPVNNIIRIHDIRFDTEWATRGCQNYHLLSHSIQPEVMKEMYENIITNKALCVKEVVKRESYLYNWSVPPSQCCSTNMEAKLDGKKH